MTKEKLDSVFRFYADFLRSDGAFRAERMDTTRRASEVSPVNEWSHMLWMCEEARKLVAENRVEKAMRWLGFLQGMFYARGVFSIDRLSNHSRPDEPTTDGSTPMKRIVGRKLVDMPLDTRSGREDELLAAAKNLLNFDAVPETIGKETPFYEAWQRLGLVVDALRRKGPQKP